MIYMFLNAFIIFPELNTGVRKNINSDGLFMVEPYVLLKQCIDCGHMSLSTNGYILDDIHTCGKCKLFFIDDDNKSDFTDNEINECTTDKDDDKCGDINDFYDKCKTYNQTRSAMSATTAIIKKKSNKKRKQPPQKQNQSGGRYILPMIRKIYADTQKYIPTKIHKIEDNI